MEYRLTGLLLLVSVFAGCKAVDGVYLPGCQAYAGDRIELSDGQFVWEKFTDAVRVDEAGNTVDPFPGFPKRGTYQLDGQMLQMKIADENSSETMYLNRHDGRALLLTEAQHALWASSGRLDDCVLTRAEQP